VNILTQADKCLGGECSVDDVSELLVQIRVQIKALKESTAALEQLEGELSGKNTGVATDQVNKQTKHTTPESDGSAFKAPTSSGPESHLD